MIEPAMRVGADFNVPIVFRTTSDQVYLSTVRDGSLWLRSDHYYREVEDAARRDASEGVNFGVVGFPLEFFANNGSPITSVHGPLEIGQVIRPHYIASFHGSSISQEQRKAFGGRTFGVRNLAALSVQILFEASRQITCRGYSWGQVYYQRSALMLSLHSNGSSALELSGNPPAYVNPVDTDVLRKSPVLPFIEQDEWRVVIYTNGYLSGDPAAPLKIAVDPAHFYCAERE